MKTFEEQIKTDLAQIDRALRDALKFLNVSDSQVEEAMTKYHTPGEKPYSYALDDGYEAVFSLYPVGNLLVPCRHCCNTVNSTLNLCGNMYVAVQVIECQCCGNSYANVVRAYKQVGVWIDEALV